LIGRQLWQAVNELVCNRVDIALPAYPRIFEAYRKFFRRELSQIKLGLIVTLLTEGGRHYESEQEQR